MSLAMSRYWRVSVIRVFCCAFLLCLVSDSSLAQEAPGDSAAIESSLQEGIAYLEEGSPGVALTHLQDIGQAHPAYVSPEYGAVSYWLGRAYMENGEPSSALHTWSEGIEALTQAGTFDLRLADAFARGVFEEEDGRFYGSATDAYLRLMEAVGAELSEADRKRVRPHLRALIPVLPPSLQEEVGLPEAGEEIEIETLASNAGEEISRWWRSQDPRPASDTNDRVKEHLERFMHAWNHYQQDGQFDDRGHVYLRLGEPYDQTTIDFGRPELRRTVFEVSPSISESELPANEFWVYRHVDRSAHYLFIEEGPREYELGTPEDLTAHLSPTSRQAEEYIRVLEEIHRQLATYHVDFSGAYQELTEYVSALNTAEELGGDMRDLPYDRSPVNFARGIASEIENESWRMERQRSDFVPRTYSQAAEEATSFPVYTRTARFLEDDGATRTDIYWSATIESLQPSEEDLPERLDEVPDEYLLSVTLSHEDANFREQNQETKRLAMAQLEEMQDELITPRTHAVRSTDSLFHVGMQWDLYNLRSSLQDEFVQTEALLQTGTAHHDSLEALDPDQQSLEMSDLKPLLTDGDGGPTVGPDGTPYPYPFISPDAEIALYFEIYGLTFGADDLTQYTVEYDVERRNEQGEPVADEPARTVASTTHESTSRAVDEYIVLDPSEWVEDDVYALHITTRITDEVTGETVERAVNFDIARQRAAQRW